MLQPRITPCLDTEKFYYNNMYSELTVVLSTSKIGQGGAADRLAYSAASELHGSTYVRPSNEGRDRPRNQMNFRSMVRAPDYTMENMHASQLQQLKSRTGSLPCRKVGHGRQDCTERDKQPMVSVFVNLIKKLVN